MNDYSEAEINQMVDQLHETIIEMKKKVKLTRLNASTVYLPTAASLCNIGATANQVQQILVRQKNLDAMNNMDDLLAKYMPYLVIIAMCAATVLVAVLVVDYVK